MRKLLALFGAVGLVSMSAATVVSCNDVADLGYYADSIENNLRTENYVDGEDTDATGNTFKMSAYFNESGWFDAAGPRDAKGNPVAEKNKMTFDNFYNAIDMAISSVVSGSKITTDYTYSIKSAFAANTNVDKTTLYYATEINAKNWDSKEVTQKVVFDIHIEANKDSTLWKGTADIYMFANWSEGGEQ
jgi:hypothetical protein